jgi:hypothetical protein
MMDVQRLLEVGMKSFNIIKTLAQQGKDIMPAITAATNVFSKRADQITDKDLDEVERQLDDMLDEFEKPLRRQA